MDVVTLVRDAVELGGRNVFSCTRREWDLLVQLGRVFGWTARGAAYIRHTNSLADDELRHGYQAGEARDPKRVGADDAMSWAAALDRARRSTHVDALIKRSAAKPEEEGDIDTIRFASVLDDFIEYAYGGEFSFTKAASGAQEDTNAQSK